MNERKQFPIAIYGEFFKEINGVPNYDHYVYVQFFYDELQIYEDVYFNIDAEKPDRSSKGITPSEYYNSIVKNISTEYTQKLFFDLTSDEKLYNFQNYFEENGKKLCIFNIYRLGHYIIEKSKSYKYYKLKPQLIDTLNELKEVKEIKFVNKDGTKSITNNKSVIDIIIKALEAEKDSNPNYYELEPKQYSINELSNKEFTSYLFIKDMSFFLNQYFPGKRKKNADISTKEQELITYLMYKFNLTPAIISDSRYRQLKNRYSSINDHLRPISYKVDGKYYNDYTAYIKYGLWSKGKINWDSLEIDEYFEIEGCNFKIT